nr:hypothetical protein [Gammaproteobacteria bacterium]
MQLVTTEALRLAFLFHAVPAHARRIIECLHAHLKVLCEASLAARPTIAGAPEIATEERGIIL